MVMSYFFICLKILLSLVTMSGLYLISIKPRLRGRPDYKPFLVTCMPIAGSTI